MDDNRSLWIRRKGAIGTIDLRSPLNSSASTCLLDTFQAEEVIHQWKIAFDIDISNELNGVNKISLYQCEASHLDFFLPHSIAGSSQMYQDLQKYPWYYMGEKWEFRQALRDLSGSRRILEVGCGPGHFVEKAKNELIDSEIKGIESNNEATEQARRRNLPVERLELHELALRGELFDAVCTFQVLEHIVYPLKFLKELISIIAPGGILVLTVPNKVSFLRHQYNPLDMPPHHMTRWSPFTIKYLEKLLPIELLKLRFEPLASYHVQDFVKAYGRYWRKKLPTGGCLLSDQTLRFIAKIIDKSRLRILFRGHSLYAVFRKR